MTTILFLHGWQSVPGGVKPTFLKDHGHEVINPKLPDDNMDEAVRIAQAEFDKPVAVAQEKGQGDPWPRSIPKRRPALRSQRPKYKEGLLPW